MGQLVNPSDDLPCIGCIRDTVVIERHPHARDESEPNGSLSVLFALPFAGLASRVDDIVSGDPDVLR